jgi:hypothetical protein
MIPEETINLDSGSRIYLADVGGEWFDAKRYRPAGTYAWQLVDKAGGVRAEGISASREEAISEATLQDQTTQDQTGLPEGADSGIIDAARAKMKDVPNCPQNHEGGDVWHAERLQVVRRPPEGQGPDPR